MFLRPIVTSDDVQMKKDMTKKSDLKKKNMCSRVKMAGKLRGKTCMDWLKCLVENVTNGQECKTKPNSKII